MQTANIAAPTSAPRTTGVAPQAPVREGGAAFTLDEAPKAGGEAPLLPRRDTRGETGEEPSDEAVAEGAPAPAEAPEPEAPAIGSMAGGPPRGEARATPAGDERAPRATPAAPDREAAKDPLPGRQAPREAADAPAEGRSASAKDGVGREVNARSPISGREDRAKGASDAPAVRREAPPADAPVDRAERTVPPAWDADGTVAPAAAEQPRPVAGEAPPPAAPAAEVASARGRAAGPRNREVGGSGAVEVARVPLGPRADDSTSRPRTAAPPTRAEGPSVGETPGVVRAEGRAAPAGTGPELRDRAAPEAIGTGQASAPPTARGAAAAPARHDGAISPARAIQAGDAEGRRMPARPAAERVTAFPAAGAEGAAPTAAAPAAPAPGAAAPAITAAPPEPVQVPGGEAPAAEAEAASIGERGAHRADGARGVPAMQAPAATSPGPIARQIADALPSRLGGPVELHLDPRELGSVRITLHQVDGALTALVVAERPETAELMRRHADVLEAALREAGGRAVSVDVSGGGQGSRGERESGEGAPSPLRAEAPVAAPVIRAAASRGLDLRL